MMVLEDGTVICSWDDFDRAIDKFVEFCRENNLRFSGIYAIPRGGLVPGVCLSHRLRLPLFYHCLDKSVLVVDDIADTGKTLLPFSGKSFIFTIFYHKQSLVVPDFWVYEKTGGWIIFPWERKSV